MSNIALYQYARLRSAAERVCAATDPGEEKRLGSALFELAEELSHLDALDGLMVGRRFDDEVPDFGLQEAYKGQLRNRMVDARSPKTRTHSL